MENGILWFDDARWSQKAVDAMYPKCWCLIQSLNGRSKGAHVPPEAPTGKRLVIQLSQVLMMLEIEDIAEPA